MPTRDRRPFVGAAVAQFLAQDYPHRELIVVDDGDDAIVDLLPSDSRLRLIRLDRRMTIGAKRNIACQAAEGEVVVHWDDDDWMADWRLTYQVGALEQRAVDVCGLSRLYLYDEQARRAWEYVYPPGGNAWLAGGTLCYRKAIWSTHPFHDRNDGEDTRFVWSLGGVRLIALDNPTFYVVRLHHGNTGRRRTDQPPYRPCAPDTVEKMMRDSRSATCRGC
jgi:glycosyltransferase involved in cell wall biosynthesis